MKPEFSTLEQRLALLVEMPTISEHPTACRQAINALSEEFESLGMFVEANLDEHPYLVATTRQTKHPRLMLVAHLDVVPETNGARCKMEVDDDKLTGRGVYDMKFAIACYLELVHELAGKNMLTDYDFGIMLTTDEELGGADGVKELLEAGWSTELAFVPDGGEGWQVEQAAKGLSFVRLESTGRSAHGSRPWEGNNALTKLLPALSEIQAKYPNTTDMDALTISINQVFGGSAMNQVPDSASAVVDLRAFTTAELRQAEEFIRVTAKKYDITSDPYVGGDPVALQPDNEHVATILSILESLLGHPPEFTKSFGATDSRWFSGLGIPSFVIRPSGGDIHGPSEWMLREDLPKFYEFVRRVTENIATSKIDKTTLKAQTV